MSNKVELFEQNRHQKPNLAWAGGGLHSPSRGRKYLNAEERWRVLSCVHVLSRRAAPFVLTLAWTGARISEVLALSAHSFDVDRSVVAIVTLKRRRPIVREVPIPRWLMMALDKEFGITSAQRNPITASLRLWTCSRVTAWRWVKTVMAVSGVTGVRATPRGFRHAFGVIALEHVPITLVKKWMGHARLTTTEIYLEVSGAEELAFAERFWTATGAASHV